MEPIYITEEAATRIKEFSAKEPNKNVRVGVKGGGCSGFSYVLHLDEKQIGDLEFESFGVTVLVDKESYPYIMGMTVDWESEGLSGGFSFKNPNSKNTCGCGTSFNT